jgi:hypothetical protein
VNIVQSGLHVRRRQKAQIMRAAEPLELRRRVP